MSKVKPEHFICPSEECEGSVTREDNKRLWKCDKCDFECTDIDALHHKMDLIASTLDILSV